MSPAAFRRAVLFSWRQDVRGNNSVLYCGTYFLRKPARRHGIFFQAAYSRTVATVAGRAACKYAHACGVDRNEIFMCVKALTCNRELSRRRR